jgi:hypothetical protein
MLRQVLTRPRFSREKGAQAPFSFPARRFRDAFGIPAAARTAMRNP